MLYFGSSTYSNYAKSSRQGALYEEGSILTNGIYFKLVDGDTVEGNHQGGDEQSYPAQDYALLR
jgi:hypothetical protein